MASFSAILSDPQVRGIVQEGLLERAFHDSLFPLLMYRGEATDKIWPGNAGDTPVFSAPGLIAPNLVPLAAGQDPVPVTYGIEQWNLIIQKFPFATMDTDMPTSALAAVNLFLRNVHQLGLQAGQSLNRIARNYIGNAALSGNTVVTLQQTTQTSFHVQRINGFTTARNPAAAAGSATLFAPVSVNNPLPVIVYNGATPQAVNVTAAVPDTAGDAYGPGTLTVSSAISTAAARGAIIAVDASVPYYAQTSGSLTVDAVTATDILQMADIRKGVARARAMNVPVHPDGRYHLHLDPTQESEIFSDTAFQTLNTALPDYYMYRELALGEFQGTIVYRNTESPSLSTVVNSSGAYSPNDYFGGELQNGLGTPVPLHYGLLTGQGGLYEFWIDQGQLITEAGIAGRVGDFRIQNNGIEVYVDRCKVILREALNRLQDQVSATSLFIGGWTFRTDVLTGDAARYKRAVAIVSA